MDSRKINEQYKKIAENLIATEPELAYIRNSSARIAYLESGFAKKKGKDIIVNGQCEKVQTKNQWAINYDFTITLFLPNIKEFTEDQIRILLFHELLHVGIEYEDDGSEKYYIRPHDLEDFMLIIDKYGTSWNRT